MIWKTGVLCAFGLALGLVACQPDTQQPAAPAEGNDAVDVSTQTAQNLLTLSATGMMFEGPNAINSGWTTVRFDNQSGMVHFAVLERLPEGITIEDQLREVSPPFQAGFDQLAAGDTDAAMAAFGQLPAWFGDIVFIGGPGLVSGGLSGEATVYLEPGRYSVECYVKTAGVFHTMNAGDGSRGMLHELIVSDADGGAMEPTATVTVDISGDGIAIADGAFAAGSNMVRVNYLSQQVHGNFVGHDVHIARLEDDTDMNGLASWMDWRNPGGLETPSPVTFVGGLNEMPAGSHGYFPVELEPGRYALVSEIDDPASKGFLVEFVIPNL